MIGPFDSLSLWKLHVSLHGKPTCKTCEALVDHLAVLNRRKPYGVKWIDPFDALNLTAACRSSSHSVWLLSTPKKPSQKTILLHVNPYPKEVQIAYLYITVKDDDDQYNKKQIRSLIDWLFDWSITIITVTLVWNWWTTPTRSRFSDFFFFQTYKNNPQPVDLSCWV